jgi:hypothetical protein
MLLTTLSGMYKNNLSDKKEDKNNIYGTVNYASV